MIRIHRGSEPPELARERSRRLAKLALEWLRSAVDPTDAVAVARFIRDRDGMLDGGYDVAREVLRQRLHRKCAYCERALGKSDPIDHFRPRRPSRSGAHPGYWWLTWSWSNLLFACVDHNSGKADEFEVDGPRLCPWHGKASGERSKLLDPSVTDPQEHLEHHMSRDGHWTLQGRTELGQTTARALGLDLPSDRYDTHLSLLGDLVEDLRSAERHGPEELRALWRRKIAVYVGRADAGFRSLTRAYLAHHLGGLLDAYGLELPSLRDGTPAGELEPLFLEIPAFEGIGEELTLRILALGEKPPREETRFVIAELVGLHPWTPEDLSLVLPQSVETIRGHLRDLGSRGDIDFDGERARLKQR